MSAQSAACSRPHNLVPLLLPRSKRIRRSSEFRTVYDSGIRMTTRYFAAFCLRLQDPAQPPRFGFTVPRSVGKAVVRNRLKRRMREAVRSQLDRISGTYAIVFNPRRIVLDTPFDDLCGEVGRVLARCNEL
jgi:ribonuclease P protein component